MAEKNSEIDVATNGKKLFLASLKIGDSVNALYTDPSTNSREEIVVHRLSEDNIVAFTAICTHQGCIVEALEKTFECPCHGSVYDSSTGTVLQGPAKKSLKKFSVVVQDGALFIQNG